MELEANAYRIAAMAHAGQTRKFEEAGLPYIVHPTRVADSVRSAGEDYVATALLHDVLEDSDFTAEDLSREGIPDHIIDAVQSVTHVEGEEYIDYILKAKDNIIGRLVKMADLADNLNSLHRGSMCDKYLMAQYILMEG